MESLKNKRALITGASGGIGRAAAIELAARGAQVAVHYFKNQAGAEETAKMIPGAATPVKVIQGDLSTQAACHQAVKEAEQALGQIDILVNNAGDLIARHALADITPEFWDQVMTTNVSSALYCTQAAAPKMIQRGSGSVINLSSLAAWNGGGVSAAPYASAKGAIVSLSKALAKELSPSGIRVNCVSPGLIGETQFHARFTPKDKFENIAKSVPLGRSGSPEEVARVVAFLAGEDSAYLTGETIEINGGLYMR